MKTILVVDDHQTEFEKIADKLKDGKYRLIHASTYRQAMDQLKPGEIDVAVIDMALNPENPSDQSGLLVARDSSREIPKIMITGVKDVGEGMRKAFGIDSEGRMIVFAFLTKQDVWDGKLPDAIESAFEARLIWERRERQSIQGQLLSDYRNARQFDMVNTGVSFIVNVVFVLLIVNTIHWIHAGTAQIVLSSVVCMGIVVSEVVLNLFLAKRLEGSGRRAESYHDELIQAWRFEQLLKSTDHLESSKDRNVAKLTIIRSFAAHWNNSGEQAEATEIIQPDDRK